VFHGVSPYTPSVHRVRLCSPSSQHASSLCLKTPDARWNFIPSGFVEGKSYCRKSTLVANGKVLARKKQPHFRMADTSTIDETPGRTCAVSYSDGRTEQRI
jgi:hypothetical protein